MTTSALTWDAVIGIATGVPVGMLGVAGAQHLVSDRPRPLLGVTEVIGAGLGVVALLVPRALGAAVAAFAVLAVVFLVTLARMWRTDRTVPCGCTPFSTSVTHLSFVPAATLLA